MTRSRYALGDMTSEKFRLDPNLLCGSPSRREGWDAYPYSGKDNSEFRGINGRTLDCEQPMSFSSFEHILLQEGQLGNLDPSMGLGSLDPILRVGRDFQHGQ